jgi:hypothetical protein
VKYFDWSIDKNDDLIRERAIFFEEIVFWIMHDGLLDIVEHSNKMKYPDQKIFIVKVDEYVYLVPFIEDEEVILMKTIIPSRKMTKKYLGDKNETE